MWYLLKVSNKTPERHNWRNSDAFKQKNNFGQISHTALVFPLLTSSK